MKKTRKEREQEILARMEEGLRENEEQKKGASVEGQTESVQQETPSQEMIAQLHCRKCKALMEDGKCPACGYTMYTPIDPRIQRRVRLILTAACLVALVVIWLLTK